jgi:hypothetical protein
MQPIDRKILRRFSLLRLFPTRALKQSRCRACIARYRTGERCIFAGVGRSKNGTTEKKLAALNAHPMLLVAP